MGFYIVIDVIVIVVICRSIKTATIQQALPYTELIGYLIRSAILLRHFPDRDIYSAADKGAAYCDERVCLFLCVYLSLRGHIFGTTRPIFTKFFCTCYLYGIGSVTHWRCSDKLRISGFVDDVIFCTRLLDVAASG